MKETEIGKLVIDWLKRSRPDWHVYQEIRPSKYAGTPVADVVCIKNDEVWVIELKRRLGLNVIRQAAGWGVEFRSVAVQLPKSNSAQDNVRWWLLQIKNKWGIGSIVITNDGQITEHKRPDYPEPYIGHHTRKFLDICKTGKTKGYAEAGQKGGGYWTPYKETMKKVRSYVQKHPGCGSGDIVDALGKMHYSSKHSARTNLVKALNEIETDWCEVRRKGTFDTFYVKENI